MRNDVIMNLDLYLKLMEEINVRRTTIANIATKKNTTSSEQTDIEFMYLQIRKILELISLGSLVANREQFEKVGKKYQKFWHAKRILDEIKKLNPDFFPIPLYVVTTDVPGCVHEIKVKESGFLSVDKFIEIYEKCGALMHAQNPFNSGIDYEVYKNEIFDWVNLINKLLEKHLIRLKGEENIYIIHLTEEDDKSHGYLFEKNNNHSGVFVFSNN